MGFPWGRGRCKLVVKAKKFVLSREEHNGAKKEGKGGGKKRSLLKVWVLMKIYRKKSRNFLGEEKNDGVNKCKGPTSLEVFWGGGGGQEGEEKADISLGELSMKL